ncbi:MAG: phospholipid carrier-dependent glycosyltransferase [Candidatus Curtissbacteria bacterium]|nr:phospholipid carrier-dependent glycosyltransferase [Candidatus Curtissbacteria bacterium]
MKKYLFVSIILLASILRLYHLGSTPPSLYWDEASLGYNAYSILKTGHDEHGNFLPLTNFPAFGDYKPPLYIYATVPSIAIFGLSEFGIRFPSVFFGILTVALTYFLARKIFKNETVAILAAFFLAISPWHLQLSRGAFEGNLALFFSTLGIYLFAKFAQDKPAYIFPSALSFLLAMNTFTAQRLFVPFILLILAIQFRKQILDNIKVVAVSAVIAGVLFWPLFNFATRTMEGRLRFNEVSIFKDLKPSDESIKYRNQDNNPLISRVIHNRRLFYANEYLKHYLDAFNPTFLFTKGDINPRLSMQEVGELYYVDIALITAGIYFLISKKHKYGFLLLGWLLVSPLGPATARETPHALRMIHILPTFQLIAAFGLYHLYQKIKVKKIFITAITLLLVGQFIFYLHIYYVHWPREYSGEWQYGYKQMVNAIEPLYQEADQIIVTKNLGRPYIYLLLYLQYPPDKYVQNAKITRDQFYFINVDGFEKFHFVYSQNEVEQRGNIIYVMPRGGTPSGAQKIEEIKNLKGETVFEISKISLNQ